MGNQLTRQGRLREVVADTLPLAHLVVDAGGYLTSINQRARSLFGLVTADIGRPMQDLEVSYRPAELRSMIDQAYKERRPLEASDVERRSGNGEGQYFDVEVVPLLDNDATLLGASITFMDVTDSNRLYRELERSKQELEPASEELESTNEELQSSNEELETMNEELESTNTELQAINTELQQRSIQLDRLNSFMEQIMANLDVGVAVLDRDLRIQLWNRRAEDMWGVRAGETVGQPMLALDIGLPLAELAGPIQSCLSGGNGHQSLTLSATNRRGKQFTCRVQCSAMSGAEGVRSVILLMEAVETVPA